MSARSIPASGVRRRRVIEAAVLVVVSAVVAVALVFASRSTVHTAEDMRHLEFGLPVGWVTQDQHLNPPSFPYQAQFLSPWEHPTTVNAAALVLNLLVLSLALWLVSRAWRGLTSRRAGTMSGSAQARRVSHSPASSPIDQARPAPGAVAIPKETLIIG